MNLSVAIITYNEEENLARTLAALAPLGAELVVVDSFSTDGTVEVALSFGAEVYRQRWLGFAEQKNFAQSKCSCEWILSLDADEVLLPDTVEEIRSIVEGNSGEVWSINRRSVYAGAVLRYSWQPDRKVRLYRRASDIRWEGSAVHEYLQIGSRTVQQVRGELLHYSYRSVADHFRRTVRYAEMGAEALYDAGKAVRFSDLLIRPVFAFVKFGIIRRSLLDGIPGLVVAVSAALSTFLKYAILWNKHHSEPKP